MSKAILGSGRTYRASSFTRIRQSSELTRRGGAPGQRARRGLGDEAAAATVAH